MGIITRHAGAPFVDGETLAGADLENDFATIYDEFNGGISAPNLASSAVTTAKINDDAVTTAKIADGAVTREKLGENFASGSEVEFHAAAVTPTTSFVTLGNSISHEVGDAPVRHVVLTYSAQLLNAGSRTWSFQILKDGILLTGSDMSYQVFSSSFDGQSKFVYYMSADTDPTPGDTHTYELQIKVNSASGSPTISNTTFYAFEPRS